MHCELGRMVRRHHPRLPHRSTPCLRKSGSELGWAFTVASLAAGDLCWQFADSPLCRNV